MVRHGVLLGAGDAERREVRGRESRRVESWYHIICAIMWRAAFRRRRRFDHEDTHITRRAGFPRLCAGASEGFDSLIVVEATIVTTITWRPAEGSMACRTRAGAARDIKDTATRSFLNAAGEEYATKDA